MSDLYGLMTVSPCEKQAYNWDGSQGTDGGIQEKNEFHWQHFLLEVAMVSAFKETNMGLTESIAGK